MNKDTSNPAAYLFEGRAQVKDFLDPQDIRPIGDRVLIRDVPDEDKIGSIFIPETAADRGVGKKGLLRIGIVVAVGLGDDFIEKGYENGRVKRKYLGFHLGMSVKPGDRVLYDRRREAELYFDGMRHSLVHEEQAVFAVLE